MASRIHLLLKVVTCQAQKARPTSRECPAPGPAGRVRVNNTRPDGTQAGTLRPSRKDRPEPAQARTARRKKHGSATMTGDGAKTQRTRSVTAPRPAWRYWGQRA